MPLRFLLPLKPRQIAAAALVCAAVSCSPGPQLARSQPIETAAATGTKQFEKAIAYTSKMPWTSGNHIETLVNGDQFFPLMLSAIRSAKKTITFETYAFVPGRTAQEFMTAFCERAKAGVKVHLILDEIGSWGIGKKDIQRMRHAGVDVRIYHPFSLSKLHRFNIRDHRKIMVVDGKIGFSGGAGIGDAWRGNGHTPRHWRETHYRVTGPVVAQLQHGFNANWKKLTNQTLTGPHYFPPLRRTGNYRAHAYNAAPIDKLYTIPHTFRQTIASARKSIIIENSYVLFDRPMMKAILDARKRGVHVELILAWKYTDSWPVRYLSIYQYHKLLKAGVHIYEYRTSMIHCKVMVVDEQFSIIGSANIDPRSLYINDESNINVISKKFAREQLRIIEQDKLRCKRITKAPSPWNPLSFPQRAALSIIAPQI